MIRFGPFLWLLCFGISTASAAPPKVTALYPAGAARGTTVTVHASGSFGTWPVKVWVDQPGVDVAAATDKNKLTVTVSPDAAPGVYWLRLYDDEGSSSPRPFVVGIVPELAEIEPNEERLKPQSIAALPVVVNGRLDKANDVDQYAVSLSKGQTVIASIEANRTLGSPMDSVVQMVGPDGFVVSDSDDYHDLDSQIVLPVPADGVYVIRVFGFPATPTATIGFAGGEDFVYRLTITTGAFMEHAYPLAVCAGVRDSQSVADAAGRSSVQLIGWNIPEPLKQVAVRTGAAGELQEIVQPDVCGRAAIRFEEHATAVEQEPNGRESPQEIKLPITITGRMDQRGDVDVYRWQAKKGEKLAFRIEARVLGFPLDPTLRLTDAAGKVLAEVDDSAGGRDAELNYTVPDDGELRLIVRDLHGQGGERYVYRLSAAHPEPTYSLKVAADSFVVAPGKPAEVPVTIDRTEGFSDEIELVALGLLEGISAAAAKSAGTGDTAKTAKLTFSAAAGPIAGPFRIVGRVPGKPQLDRTAQFPLAGLNTSTADLWITVTK